VAQQVSAQPQPQPAGVGTQPQPAGVGTQPQPAGVGTQPQPAGVGTQPQPAACPTSPMSLRASVLPEAASSSTRRRTLAATSAYTSWRGTAQHASRSAQHGRAERAECITGPCTKLPAGQHVRHCTSWRLRTERSRRPVAPHCTSKPQASHKQATSKPQASHKQDTNHQPEMCAPSCHVCTIMSYVHYHVCTIMSCHVCTIMSCVHHHVCTIMPYVQAMWPPAAAHLRGGAVQEVDGGRACLVAPQRCVVL
jgi:hypothetical protein